MNLISTFLLSVCLIFLTAVGYFILWRERQLFGQKEKAVFATHLLSLFFFSVLFQLVYLGIGFSVWDLSVQSTSVGFRSGAFSKVMVLASDIGSPFSLICLSSILLAVLVWQKKYSLLAFSLFSLGGGLLSVYLLKILFALPRPGLSLIYEESFGFPSGHTAMAVIFFSLLFAVFSRDLKQGRKIIFVFLFLAVLTISLSRIYLGVHWISDVAGGLLLGLFWLTFGSLISKHSFHQ